MRKSPLILIAAAAATLAAAEAAAAQPYPPPYGAPPGPPPYGAGHRPPPPMAQQHYYNGRWIGQDEWARHSYERDRWAHDYEHRHHDHGDHDDGSAAIVGAIIGFALGAAIVGSQQQADRARYADHDFDHYCARKYRSYDPRSRTYLGVDGLRHYCE